MLYYKNTLTQGISVNTSYNPEHYEDEKVHECSHYNTYYVLQYGGKQLYYNNTYDGQGEIDINKDESKKVVEANFIITEVINLKMKIATVVNLRNIMFLIQV